MRPITKIILHHSASKDGVEHNWNEIRQYHIKVKGFSACGYHYGLENIGGYYEVLKGRNDEEVGAHAKGFNANSIGVANIGNFEINIPPEAQWKACINLVKSLIAQHELKPEDVIGHRECPYATLCPGKFWDMEKFRAELKS